MSMVLTKKVIFAELRDILILIILGIVMTAAGLTCSDCYEDTRGFWIVASFTSLVWVSLWKGNSYLSNFISSKKLSWIDYPVQRFFVGLLSTVAYTFLALYALGAVYKFLFNFNLVYGAMFSLIITIIISLFLHGREFLINWKQTTIVAERLKRENISAQYETFKSQVNPHFLFNSFNVLSNLVYEDQDKAVKFIKQLSDVYRYVLDTRNKEVVPLSEELKFLNAYIFLQQIRFENKLKIENELKDINATVAPLALQMLMENAIKHNEVSHDNPLTIRMFVDGDYIVVENNLQRKEVSTETSSGLGLENIRKRYEFLSDRKVLIVETEKSFTVKLPLLENSNIKMKLKEA